MVDIAKGYYAALEEADGGAYIMAIEAADAFAMSRCLTRSDTPRAWRGTAFVRFACRLLDIQCKEVNNGA